MTLLELCSEGEADLKRAGVEDASLDARSLFLEVWGLSLAAFLRIRLEEVKKDASFDERAARYRCLIERRANREPLQYIMGRQGFMGLEFEVNRDVLIPRQDTETLVECVLRERTDPGTEILDVCTGSGCIAVSLSVHGGYRRVVAADISEAALTVAARNVRSLAGEDRVCLVKSDLLLGLNRESRFDVIVSNPPYIESEAILGLAPEVRDFEPGLALDGGTDGLSFYRRLVGECRDHLKVQGAVYVEIGAGQARAVEGIFKENGYRQILVYQDLAGNDRVVRALI